MLDIYFSTIDNSEILKLPYVPEGVAFNDPIVTSQFENINGEVLTIIGPKGLKSLEVSTFFPHKRYRWLSSNTSLAGECIEFFQRYRLKPLRIVVASKERTYVNMLCTIADFPVSEKINKDVSYTLSITEYIDPSEVG